MATWSGIASRDWGAKTTGMTAWATAAMPEDRASAARLRRRTCAPGSGAGRPPMKIIEAMRSGMRAYTFSATIVPIECPISVTGPEVLRSISCTMASAKPSNEIGRSPRGERPLPGMSGLKTEPREASDCPSAEKK